MSDPEPSYVGVAGPVNGYVKFGYQKYYSTESGAPAPEPGTGVPPVEIVPGGTPGMSISPPAPGQSLPIYTNPPTPPNWPTLPPTLPPVGCPPLDSTWAAGPIDPGSDQIGYTPPISQPNDDGITFPASLSDLILRNQWHGLPSTINPLNLELTNLQLQQTIHDAIKSAKSEKTELSPSGSGIKIVYPDAFNLQNAVQQQIITQMLQGTGLWYELVLKPLDNGPFANYYVINTTELAIPKTFDLAAPSG